MLTVDQWLASVLVALITALATIIVAGIQAGRTAKKAVKAESVEIEHRLTVLEQNQFNKEDRDCLQELKTQMRFILNLYVKEAVIALKNPPQLRAMFLSIETGGYSVLKELSPTERVDLQDYLDEQLKSPSDEKRQHAKMLIGLLNLDQSIKDACATPSV